MDLYELWVRNQIEHMQGECMDRIEQLRNRLYATLDNGSIEEVLEVSKELDIAIIRFYNTQSLRHSSSEIEARKERNKGIDNG